MNTEKTARNQKIIKFYEKHQGWSYAAIARMLHVKGDKGYHSRQIVRRVIARHLVKMSKMQ